jgi:hypothetical protein
VHEHASCVISTGRFRKGMLVVVAIKGIERSCGVDIELYRRGTMQVI